MKEGEVAHERRQEEFAGVVKEQFRATAKETTQLVEGLRVEVSAAQQETVEATTKALETVGGQIQQVREQGEQRHAESLRRFTEGLEENRKEQDRRHQ